jgi:hypothetical protein
LCRTGSRIQARKRPGRLKVKRWKESLGEASLRAVWRDEASWPGVLW